MKLNIVFGIVWSLVLSILSVLVFTWTSGLPITEFLKFIIQGVYVWAVFFAWAYPLWLIQKKRPKKNMLISDASREHMQLKTDADLQTIIDSLDGNPSDLIRQAAMEEKYAREETRKKRITRISLIGLVIALLSLLVAVAKSFRVP
jgi:hypothetical protein